MAAKTQSYEIKNPCGYGVIIVNTFNGIENQERDGTDTEKEKFRQLFELIGLEVILFEELSKDAIMSKLETITGDDKLKNHSMIAVAISSHGGKNGLYGINIQERLDRMKNKESVEGLNDTITLADLKDVFSFEKCPNLQHKPKLLLLNGWKECAEESLCKFDTAPPTAQTVKSDVLAICSSFDNCGAFLLTQRLPPSLFPSILLDTVLEYKKEPINNLVNVVNGELLKSSKKIIKVQEKSIAIHETCTHGSRLLHELYFCFKDSGPASGAQQPTT